MWAQTLWIYASAYASVHFSRRRQCQARSMLCPATTQKLPFTSPKLKLMALQSMCKSMISFLTILMETRRPPNMSTNSKLNLYCPPCSKKVSWHYSHTVRLVLERLTRLVMRPSVQSTNYSRLARVRKIICSIWAFLKFMEVKLWTFLTVRKN